VGETESEIEEVLGGPFRGLASARGKEIWTRESKESDWAVCIRSDREGVEG